MRKSALFKDYNLYSAVADLRLIYLPSIAPTGPYRHSPLQHRGSRRYHYYSNSICDLHA